ncbi:MAG: hypothetical protein ACTSQB_03110, partial [Candidatus Heimdallarchaeota archaeon]
MNKRLLGILIIPLFTFAYISNTNLQFSDADWDPSYWSITKPYEQDMSARKLNLMTQYMESWNDEHSHSHIDGAVVIRNGFLIKEWYGYTWDKDDNHAQWSVTKSFISTLIGIAIYRGFIPSVNEYVLDYFSEYNISNVDFRKEAM